MTIAQHLPETCHGRARFEAFFLRLIAAAQGHSYLRAPLTRPTVAVLRSWLSELAGPPDAVVFPTRRDEPLSRDAVERLVAKHAASCPSLTGRKVTPHTLRHSCAMALLHAGVDTTVIALWLGHEQTDTTMIYLHADLTLKEKALNSLPQTGAPVGRYRPPDAVLAFLDNL